MMEYLRGTLAAITPTYAIIETSAGIGYIAQLSLVSYDTLCSKLGQPVQLLVHQLIREDAWQLFGFATEAERSLFRSLIGVSGVGANTARLLLSSANPDELGRIIADGDVKRLKSVKGVGAKTAERIIVDLKDKIKPAGGTLSLQTRTLQNEAAEEALAALTMLGFAKAAAQKVLDRIYADAPATTSEQAIKRALTMM